jgi:hypothetical protein
MHKSINNVQAFISVITKVSVRVCFPGIFVCFSSQRTYILISGKKCKHNYYIARMIFLIEVLLKLHVLTDIC